MSKSNWEDSDDDDLPSYEDAALLKPSAPPPPEAYDAKDSDAQHWIEPPNLQYEEAKQAIIDKARRAACWGRGAAENIEITKIEHSYALTYDIYSWSEEREIENKTRKYKRFENSSKFRRNARSYGIWDVPIDKPNEFTEADIRKKIPNSERKIKCTVCFGNKRINGGQSCETCNGRGKLVQYNEVIVRYKVRKDHILHEASNMPDKKFTKAAACEMMNETQYRLGKIKNFDEPEFQRRANQKILEFSNNFPNEMCHRQKHNVGKIPIDKVFYTHKQKSGIFYVYGLDKHVFSRDYPEQYCCCMPIWAKPWVITLIIIILIGAAALTGYLLLK